MTEQNKSPEAIQTVRLMSLPENLIDIIYTAMKACTSEGKPEDIFHNCAAFRKCAPSVLEGNLQFIKKVIDSGHHSVLEHCYFVFSLSGLSKAMTHQIVRHRHMSFSQKSQRYVAEKGQFEYVTPIDIATHPAGPGGEDDLKKEYDEFMANSARFYRRLIEFGKNPEDARMILPNAASSSMVASLNLRELIHLANLRTCMKAQKEIRDAVKKMCDLVIEKEPWTAAYLVPNCVKNGVCKEMKGCGRFKNESN